MSSPRPDPIPFNALSRTEPDERDAIAAAIARVQASGWFVLGPEHDAFEQELATFVGRRHAVGVANGTDALELALRALGVGAGDTVLTAANAGGYTSVATRLLGATPVYCDVDESTLLVSAATVEAALDELPAVPRAIVVTHLYGATVDVAPIVELAHARGIRVLEDCAQSIGSSRGGRRSGSFADVATTSFYPTKNLGALGDGGAVLCDDDDIAGAVRRGRQYGWDRKYHIAEPGGRNSRLDEMQAAILRARLPHLDARNERRRALHRVYEGVSSDAVRVLNTGSEAFTGHLAVIVTDRRDDLRAAFRDAGIGTDVHYPIPDHRQPALPDSVVPLPVTERAAEQVLSVPLFPELRDDEAARVAHVLAQAGDRS
jgi:dTDP-3-amino-2,3,6-trideoxy-4-keto-D-glucose/dTDP-3-amino-3,4,6-trideoxy-alpha-D-glucose/dTDP-2,6-dideoxy-D-kanosamine transaminase